MLPLTIFNVRMKACTIQNTLKMDTQDDIHGSTDLTLTFCYCFTYWWDIFGWFLAASNKIVILSIAIFYSILIFFTNLIIVNYHKKWFVYDIAKLIWNEAVWNRLWWTMALLNFYNINMLCTHRPNITISSLCKNGSVAL